MPIDFDSLVTANMSAIRNIARSYANSHDADDLKQEILVQLWRSRKSFRGDSSAKTWLYRIALNTAITFQRKEIRHRTGLLKTRSLRSEAVHHAGLPPNEILEEFVADLGDIDRAIFSMYLDGLSTAAMEDVLGIKANAINVRVSRMKSKFAEHFVS